MVKQYNFLILLGPFVSAFSGILILFFSFGMSKLVFTGLLLVNIFIALRSGLEYKRGFIFSTLISSLLYLLVNFSFPMIEASFKDGPFYTEEIESSLKDIDCHKKIQTGEYAYCLTKTSNGFLPDPSKDPLLSLIDRNGNLIRTVKFTTAEQMPNTRVSMIRSIQFESGILRNRTKFAGCWKFGCEAGVLYLTKWHIPIRFYLSW